MKRQSGKRTHTAQSIIKKNMKTFSAYKPRTSTKKNNKKTINYNSITPPDAVFPKSSIKFKR